MKKLILVVSLFAFSCSDLADPPKGKGWINNGNNNGTNNGTNNGNNNGTNNGNNNGTISGPYAGLSVRNTGVSSIWYTESFSVIGEDGVPVSVDHCSGNRDFIGEFANELRPSHALELEWRGERFNGNCEQAEPFTSGTFRFEFCYALNVESGFNNSLSGETFTCESRDFRLEDGSDVAIEIGFDARNHEDAVEIVLRNEAGENVWYEVSHGCSANGWLTIGDYVRDLTINPIDYCGTCDCSDGNGCDIACPACAQQFPQALADREFVTAVYNGLYQDLYGALDGSEGPQCAQTQLAPHNLEATVCYQYTQPADGEGLLNPTCETLPFALSDEVVEFVIPALPVPG